MPSTINSFVDLEAQVDEGEESEVSQEGEDALERDVEDAFIDDTFLEDFETTHARMIDREAESTRLDFEELMEGILLTAKHRSRKESRQWGAYKDTTHVFRLRDDDYPLWRVQCRYGVEETAIISILQTANEIHEIRSAFTKRTVRGSIYVESTMNLKTIELLRITPGIMTGRNGVIRRMIDTGDYAKTMNAKDIDQDFSVGDWVRVRRGLYEGDLGIVDRVEGWGATVLMLPRMSLDNSLPIERKRKASIIRPMPNIFLPEELQPAVSIRMRRLDSTTHQIGNMRFEYGLLSKGFEFSTLTKNVHRVAHATFTMFERSRHPRVLEHPTLCPTEWCIQEGDRISHRITRECGIIKTVYQDRAEVEFEHGRLQGVWWRHVQKLFFIGEAVTIIGGPNAGVDGWVVSCTGDLATVLSGKRATDPTKKLEYVEVDVRVNSLKKGTTASTEATSASEQTLRRAREPHPWIGTHVIICRQGHPRKGDTGRVLNILPPRPGQADPVIEIQLTRYNPSEPYRNITVDYNDIVESSKFKLLHKIDVRTLGTVRSEATCNLAIGGQTPMPTDTSGTPAWNPHDNIEDWAALHLGESPAVQAVPTDRHILLNPMLAGVKLHAVIEGQKNIGTVTADFSNGPGCLRGVSYHTSNRVPDDKVKPKHPSPTHDNGLLVILRGDYVGKYARRVYHRHVKEGTTLVKVAIVEVEEGSVDRDTGKILEMETGDLCTVEESEKQKKLNKKPMEEMRHRLKKAPLS